MSYIAFIGYNESDFKNFKIGNKNVQICNKSEYPDPNMFLLRNSQNLGVKGEEYIKNLLTKLITNNKSFCDFELIDKHYIPHNGDFHLINTSKNIMFMIEVKNKNKISVKEDLEKFDKDIETVKQDYNNVIGLFLSVGCDKITNHNNIELNNETIYLSRDYVNIPCLELVITHYITLTDNKFNIKAKKEDITFLTQVIKQLETMKTAYDEEIKRINRVLVHNEKDTKYLTKTVKTISNQTETITQIIQLYETYKIEQENEANKEDNKEDNNLNNYDSNDLEDLPEIIAEPVKDITEADDFEFLNCKPLDAMSCINTTKNNNDYKTGLFIQLKKDKITAPSSLTKKQLTKHYPKYLKYIASTNIKTIVKDYRIYLNNNK